MRILYGLVFLHLGKIYLYMYYLHRIMIVFENSVFRISQRLYNYAKILLFGSSIIFSIGIQTSHILGNETEYFHLSQHIIIIEYIIGALLDVFWGTFLTGLFLIRMKRIIKLNKTDDGSNYVNDDRIQNGCVFKYVACKLTILYSIVFISTILGFVLTIIDARLFGSVLIDCFINSMCLILSFNFYDKSYKKLCYFCRLCCETK